MTDASVDLFGTEWLKDASLPISFQQSVNTKILKLEEY